MVTLCTHWSDQFCTVASALQDKLKQLYSS